MSIFTRSVLQKAFPDNPRVVAAFERLDDLLSSVDSNGQTLTDQVASISALLDGNANVFQKSDPLLDSLAGLPARVGALEVTNDGSAAVRPIDAQDPASLVTRGAGYTVYIGHGGMGATANRPSLPKGYAAVYFDTTLGKPVFLRPDSVWVDSTGAAV